MERRRAIIVALSLVSLAAVIGTVLMLTRTPAAPKASPHRPPPQGAPQPERTSVSSLDSVPAVIEPKDLAAAHQVMRDYLVAAGTYTYRTDTKSWTAKTRALTDGSANMAELTALPSGRSWDQCVVAKCSSSATADLQRDTVITNTPVKGAGRSVTALASTVVTVHQEEAATQTTDFSITATYISGGWKVSGLQLAGLGNAGLEDGS